MFDLPAAAAAQRPTHRHHELVNVHRGIHCNLAPKVVFKLLLLHAVRRLQGVVADMQRSVMERPGVPCVLCMACWAPYSLGPSRASGAQPISSQIAENICMSYSSRAAVPGLMQAREGGALAKTNKRAPGRPETW